MSTTTTPIGDAREQALDRLRKRQDLRGHLLVYALVNVVLWSIWASVGGGFPWPLFVNGRLGHRRGDERLGRLLAASDHRA
jgi:hypothetical protein